MACLLPGILMLSGHAGHGTAALIDHIVHAKQLTQAAFMTVLFLIGMLAVAVTAAFFSPKPVAVLALTSYRSYRSDRVPIPASDIMHAWLSLFESSPTTFRPA